ncbi:unnamed protein product [Musa acuminata subsp. malaccensis]|uniref:(wild Malaysian banana) hypothetical protein n=1 Tax=Musa acuminata subsp. malaccensis TaxID=214687 RepID=A0A804JYY7_MUSAM|nr:PREDICTED: probable WRKY transcription factor 70 [Musa acuminata subsp. malaccensis]CAG1857539.1 unnamed protein product [Musa acuminata subsp. malaccensis]
MKGGNTPHAEAAALSPCGRRAAIQDISRAHELTSQLQAVLLHLPAGSWSQLGQDMAKQILQLTTSALSTLQFCGCGASDDGGTGNCSGELSKSSEGRDGPHGRRTRRKNKTSTKVKTTVPYEDGYQWRKYGQKTINDAMYPRCYYKCTYRDDQGCPATKTVQQQDSYADPPTFMVEYSMKHTCKTPQTIFPVLMVESSPQKASLHGSDSTGSSDLQDLHLSPPSSVVTHSESHDKCSSSNEQEQPCQHEGLITVNTLDELDMESMDLFMRNFDGWFYVE